jgi:adenylate kinase
MTKPIGLLFLGPPGSGKGTQAQILAQSLHVPHISTGEILREAIAKGTELGKQAQSYVDKGELVPDQLLLELIQNRLQEADAQKGWILDGFPRTVAQASFLDQLLAEMNQFSECIVNLDVPENALVKRLLGRGRKDDNEETIRRRLEVYQEQTAPLLDYYQQHHNFNSVNGNCSMEEVTASLKAIVAA